MDVNATESEKQAASDLSTPNNDTIGRLRRWETERPVTRVFERKARHQIVKAAIVDIKTRATVLPKDQILSMTSRARAKIDNLIPRGEDPNVSQEFSAQNIDSVTKEPYITRFRRETGGTLVAEEVRQQGNVFDVISQVRVFLDGRTELTLNFTGSRYEDEKIENSKNPRIIIDSKFPRAAATTFNLLVGTVK